MVIYFFTVRTTHHTQNVPSGKILNRISYFGAYQFHQQTLSPTNNFIPPPLWGILRYGGILWYCISIWKMLSLSNLISTSLKARNSSDISSSKHQPSSLLGSKECQPVCYFNCCHEIKLQWCILSSHLFRSSAWSLLHHAISAKTYFPSPRSRNLPQRS